MAQTFLSTSSVTACAAALRPPFSMASAMGAISSNVSPAFCSSTSAEPRMFCTLFARYIAAISLAPSLPSCEFLLMLPTITAPKSSDAGFLPAFFAPSSMLPRA